MTVGGSQINGKLKSIEDGSNPFQEIVPSHGRFEDIPGTCLKAVCGYARNGFEVSYNGR